MKGKIYFASLNAQRERHYREGQTIDLSTIACVRKYEILPNFWVFVLDSSGTSYIDVSVES